MRSTISEIRCVAVCGVSVEVNGVLCSLVSSLPRLSNAVQRVSDTELATRVVLPFEKFGMLGKPLPS
jgi:hypothetical protein